MAGENCGLRIAECRWGGSDTRPAAAEIWEAGDVAGPGAGFPAGAADGAGDAPGAAPPRAQLIFAARRTQASPFASLKERIALFSEDIVPKFEGSTCPGYGGFLEHFRKRDSRNDAQKAQDGLRLLGLFAATPFLCAPATVFAAMSRQEPRGEIVRRVGSRPNLA